MASGGVPGGGGGGEDCPGPSPQPAPPKAAPSASPSKASSSSSAAAKAKRGSYQSRQRRMGPAPFASFEDLSDELESPDEAKTQRALLPGIREDSGLGGLEDPGVSLLAAAKCLQTPSTPRIDISRASSSSQHEESGGSSGGAGGGSPEGRDPLATVAGLAAGFKEEGTADLRSSTEELDYHGSEKEIASTRRSRSAHRGGSSQPPRRKSAERGASPLLMQSGRYELDAQSDKERKDSACSEGPLGLLGVGGRTSRLSSVGSAGSGASGASGMSGLSAASALSGAASSSGMRSPSPHKMLLETSFCGSKPIPTKSMEMDDMPPGLEPETKTKSKKRTSKGKEGDHPAPGGGRQQEKPATLDLKATESHYARPPAQAVVQATDGPREAVSITPSSSTQSCQSTSSRQPPAATSKSVSSTPSASPKLSRHSILKKATEDGVVTPVSEDAGQSPSPATSRKSSFTGLFGRRSDSGNLLSPESPTVGAGVPSASGKLKGSKGAISAAIGGLRERSRSRSKSREHIEQTGLSIAQQSSQNASTMASGGAPSPSSAESKSKKDSSRNKGVFSSFFKKKDKSKKSKSGSSSGGPSLADTASEGDPLSPDTLSPDVIDADGKIIPETIGNVEFTFNGDSNFQNADFGLPESESRAKTDNSQKTGPPAKAGIADRNSFAHDEFEDKNFSQNILSAPIREEEEKELRKGGKQQPDLFGETRDVHPGDEDHHSSESEREVEYLQSKEKKKDEVVGDAEVETDHERKGLVLQQDSFEDELPYIPTTLPQERSVALPIKPVRQRTLAEIKTCPIERPRSTTPINPSALEDFLVAASTSLKGPSSSSGSSTVDERDRLRISLPREDSTASTGGGDVPLLPPRSRSPRYSGSTPAGGGTVSSSWVQFPEDTPHESRIRGRHRSGGGGTSADESVKSPASQHSSSASPPPPPLPPRGFQPPMKQWVNFEEIPEKRKTPKKLHDLSKDVNGGRSSSKSAHHQRMVYSYVNPEDCKCECHETGRPGTADVVESGGGGSISERSEKGAIAKVRQTSTSRGGEGSQSLVGDRERPSSDGRKDSIVSVGEVSRLEVDNLADRHSYQSDSSCELPNNYSVDQQETDMSEGLLKPMKPFGMDLDVSSNRSSIISQDEPVSPENGSPNQKELLHQ
ncbi:uncharacterized protein LOC124154075 [Ischnura elegans]|uniref:uncharacterized protein LOC124154075 n=1 Tax=Ischnura elegans TaxID=197161 RepID=UPI001ED8762F|nr:uncharacterized protein LOC124154075 [Ischnura elegans]XP_046383531.1 uncharacterized protein LOC124154075 [Ischnura elegans]